MSERQAKRQRAQAGPIDDILWVSINGGEWTDILTRNAEIRPEDAGFTLHYMLHRGYVRRVAKPVSGALFNLRWHGRYYRPTVGLVALYLAGAEPDTPVPTSLRSLDARGGDE
jgi:hypothetical protein